MLRRLCLPTLRVVPTPRLNLLSSRCSRYLSAPAQALSIASASSTITSDLSQPASKDLLHPSRYLGFMLVRNPKTNNLPIYTKFLANGIAHTTVRNYKGHPKIVVDLIRKVVGVETRVEVRIGKIEIRGNWERQLKYFFEKLGY